MLNQQEALDQLRRASLSFPPLRIEQLTSQPQRESGPRPDWLLVLAWGETRQAFAVEYKSLSTPKRLRDALAQARTLATESDLQPMVMTPYLDEEALDMLVREGISGIDFSGNGVVMVPGSWFVYRTGKPNAYPSSEYIKAIYSGRSSFVGRTLLVRRRFDTVSAVKEEIDRRGGMISLPTVSKVLKKLEEELIVSRREGITLLQPDKLLNALVAAFKPPVVTRRKVYRSEDLSKGMRALVETATREGLSLAARGEQRYTFFPGSDQVLSVYTEKAEPLATALPFEETRRFGNLELLETRDETVFFDRRRESGFFWTSPVQTYLELATGGKREQETAAQLRTGLLAGEYDGPAA